MTTAVNRVYRLAHAAAVAAEILTVRICAAAELSSITVGAFYWQLAQPLKC